MTSPWWHQAVIYQVYPRSFADSDGDGVGDLRGLIKRLDHLSWLGVDAIWLSPIFSSPMVDFGYDISDHCRVDALFGSDEDALQLIDEAHARDMRVLFDIVLGHTSDQHPWFLRSRAAADSTERDLYVWRDGPTPGSEVGGPPNNWTAGFPEGASAWSFDPLTTQWYLHSHLPEQPDLNWENPAVAERQEAVLRHWLDRGVDGVRLDSINRLGKDPLLRDNIEGEPLRQQDWPNLHPRLARVRQVLEEYPDVLAVGETWVFEQQQLVPYLRDDELHLAHNFVFARVEPEAHRLRAVIEEFASLIPEPDRAAWFFTNHDELRLASRFNEDGRGLARAELLMMLLLVLRGTVFLYQGDELGLPDADVPDDRVVDKNGRDPQRAPIPWADPRRVGPGAGFTTGEPWLPFAGEAELNVESQHDDPHSTLHYVRRLIALRREHLAAPTSTHEVDVVNDGVLRVRQETDCATVEALMNVSARAATCQISPEAELLVSTDRARRAVGSSGWITLAPLEGVVIRSGLRSVG